MRLAEVFGTLPLGCLSVMEILLVVVPGLATALEFFMTLLAANFGTKLVSLCYVTAF